MVDFFQLTLIRHLRGQLSHEPTDLRCFILEEHTSWLLSRKMIKDCNQRFNFFNNRVLHVWNSLPDEIVAATSTNVFIKGRKTFFQKKSSKVAKVRHRRTS